MKQLFALFKSTFFLYLAQVVSLVLGWLIARLNVTYLSVEEYGQFNFFITIINATFIFFTFGVFEASSRLLAISDSPERSRRLVTAALVAILGIYGLFSLFLLLVRPLLQVFFSVDISRLIGIFFPLAGVYLLYDFWQKILRGSGEIKDLSWFLISPRVLYSIFLMGLVYFGQFRLSQSILFNLLSFALVFLVFMTREPLDFNQFKASLSELRSEVKRFGLNIYGADLIQSLLFQLDKLLIAFFLDAEQLAYYSLAFTITMPISLFSNALSTAFYRGFSRASRIDRRIVQLNVLWVITSLVILIVMGNWIVENLFSQKYTDSIPVLIPLAIAFGISGQSKIYSFYLIARGEGGVIRNISAAILSINLAGYLILIPWIGIMGAAISRIITFGADWILTIFFYRRRLTK